MPIYTYKCDSCRETFEFKQRMTDDPLEKCVLCSENGVRRVINSVGILFKGNGFYVTDNRGKNGALAPNKTSESGEAKEPTASAGEPGKKETAPAKEPSPATD